MDMDDGLTLDRMCNSIIHADLFQFQFECFQFKHYGVVKLKAYLRKDEVAEEEPGFVYYFQIEMFTPRL